LLFAQWKHRGIRPSKAWAGFDVAPWPAREEAVLKAFAIHAAEIETTTHDLLQGILGALGDD